MGFLLESNSGTGTFEIRLLALAKISFDAELNAASLIHFHIGCPQKSAPLPRPGTGRLQRF
jgi:hypothetical protein